MKEKKEGKTKGKKQEIRFSFFKPLLKKKTSIQVLPESQICNYLNIEKK
jgi:hypothetical protein